MRSWLSAGFLATAVLLLAQAMPRMTTVEPSTGKAGTDIKVAGEALSKNNVVKVYLSDGKTDVELALTTQEDTAITFKVPASAKPGRYGLAILTRDQKLIDQPVKLTVE